MIDAFDGEDASVSVILFSGPRTWTIYNECNSNSMTDANLKTKCGIEIVEHFTTGMTALKTKVGALKFPSASTYTQKALELANAELTLSRPGANRVVLMMTDGIPISPHKTQEAAEKVRRRARLMIGAVRLNQKGLQYMQSWASSPTHDNVLKIKDFEEMEEVSTINALVRDMCSVVEKKVTTTTTAASG